MCSGRKGDVSALQIGQACSGIYGGQSATGTGFSLSQFQSASDDNKLIVSYYVKQKFLILAE
jgi:hypothetical protein